MKCGWGGKWSLPPRVSETGGIHILPYLTVGDLKYPLGMTIPENTAETRSIVASLKKRFAKKWRRELWKHIVRVIIEDIRYYYYNNNYYYYFYYTTTSISIIPPPTITNTNTTPT